MRAMNTKTVTFPMGLLKGVALVGAFALGALVGIQFVYFLGWALERVLGAQGIPVTAWLFAGDATARMFGYGLVLLAWVALIYIVCVKLARLGGWQPSKKPPHNAEGNTDA